VWNEVPASRVCALVTTIQHRRDLIEAPNADAHSLPASPDDATSFAAELLLVLAYGVLLVLTPIVVAAMAFSRLVTTKGKARPNRTVLN
jgi:hypothetical protein